MPPARQRHMGDKASGLPTRHDRRPRLDASVYEEPGYAVHVIIGTHLGRPVFTGPNEPGEAVVAAPEEAAGRAGVRLYCYCLMPDHVHIVASIEPGGKGIHRFVWYLKRLTKAKTGSRMSGSIWQRSFYDHVLRDAEDLGDLCRYVVNNPVRKGIVERWEDYPYVWLSEEI